MSVQATDRDDALKSLEKGISAALKRCAQDVRARGSGLPKVSVRMVTTGSFTFWRAVPYLDRKTTPAKKSPPKKNRKRSKRTYAELARLQQGRRRTPLPLLAPKYTTAHLSDGVWSEPVWDAHKERYVSNAADATYVVAVYKRNNEIYRIVVWAHRHCRFEKLLKQLASL